MQSVYCRRGCINGVTWGITAGRGHKKLGRRSCDVTRLGGGWRHPGPGGAAYRSLLSM